MRSLHWQCQECVTSDAGHDGITTTWFKVKNPQYSQGIDRADLFPPRRSMTAPSRAARPVLSSELSRS